MSAHTEEYETAEDELVIGFQNGELLQEYLLEIRRVAYDIDLDRLDFMHSSCDLGSSTYETMSITLFEDFPNEFFYEMFKYLDGCEIYQAFSNLNHRFHQLFHSSSLLFKISFYCSTSNKFYTDICQHLLLNNKHQILSLYLCLPLQKIDLLSSVSIDSSFNRLESVVLRALPPTILLSCLTNLSSLPRLFSLTIDTEWTLRDLTEVYQLIFTLPKLKYMKCSAESTFIPVSLPIAADEQPLSIIEKLVIDHSCTFNELCTIISYTPELRHLNLMDLSENDSNLEMILSNLTYLSIEMCCISFDALEMFIIETECHLKVLHLSIQSEDQDYLDADRWEDLILDYLPQLKDFSFQYYQDIDPESGSLRDFQPPDAFNSPFWNERKWVFEVKMDSCEITYSISSYRERWYDIKSSNELSQSTRLILISLPRDECLITFQLTIRDILAITQIYHLEISKENISFNLLIDLIYKLSALRSLKVTSLILSLMSLLSIDERNLHFVANRNKITKIYLEKMNTIEDVYFLIKLCPCMTYLKMDLINNMKMELLVRNILIKINNDDNQYLRSLCLYTPTRDDGMIQQLEDMIDREKLLHHFTVKHVLDHVYLEWK